MYGDYGEYREELTRLRDDMSKRLAEQGKLESDKEKYERQLESRVELIHQEARNYSIRGFDVDLDDRQIQSFNDRMQSPAVSSVEGDLTGAVEGGEACEAPKKKGSGASQANDQELRRLFRENDGRNLLEVASEVKREEKGPKAEKSKQVFGMLW